MQRCHLSQSKTMTSFHKSWFPCIVFPTFASFVFIGQIGAPTYLFKSIENLFAATSITSDSQPFYLHISESGKPQIFVMRLRQYLHNHRPQAIEGISRDACVIFVSCFIPVLIRGQPPSTFVWARRKNICRKQWSMVSDLIHIFAEH